MGNFQGDLTDIIRASGASYGSSTSSSEAIPFSHDNNNNHWQFSSIMEDSTRGNFGDPFSNTRDPFLNELDYMLGYKRLEEACCFGSCFIDTFNSSVLAQEILEDDMTRFSPNAKLAMSPCDSPRVVKTTVVASGNMINANTSEDHCLMDNTGVQISSPRNRLRLRKNQGKKSICIPAPTAPNSRQSGEVVPSDLWAWRKYGQKPIKGSPYPRGYYRCSSSKGCPARKQVERSRTDPNMLVITYSSEHNHPWPTQRNALAGSTRSNNIANSKTTQPQKGTITKQLEEEQHEISNSSDSNVSQVVAAWNSSSKRLSIKEETKSIKKQQLEMDSGEFSNGFLCNQLENFLAGLGEVEADSLNLFFPKCFHGVDDRRESKGLDPFLLFEWSGDKNTKYHLI